MPMMIQPPRVLANAEAVSKTDFGSVFLAALNSASLHSPEP
jgi:hypothetical protein